MTLCAAGGLILASLTAAIAPGAVPALGAILGIAQDPPAPSPPPPPKAPAAAPQKAAEPVYRTMSVGGLQSMKINDRQISFYQARPEGEGTWPGVILASSGWGIDVGFKQFADHLAAEGFFVMAPDINSGKVAKDADKAREMGVIMNADQAVADLNALAAHLRFRSEVGDHRVGLVGIDSGGRVALTAARLSEDFSCVVAAYAVPEPDASTLRRINMPILTIFGLDDPFTPPAAVAALKAALDEAGRTADVKVYDGAGRAFMEQREAGYNATAAADAFSLIVAFLRNHL